MRQAAYPLVLKSVSCVGLAQSRRATWLSLSSLVTVATDSNAAATDTHNYKSILLHNC